MPPVMRELLILQDDNVLLKKPGEKGFRKQVKLPGFLTALGKHLNSTPGEAVTMPPFGAKAMWRNGKVSVIHIELAPTCRVVHWITDDSEVDYGEKTKDKPASLAFPFIDIFVLCHGDALAKQQCLYFRTKPVESMDDQLYQSNMLNVSDVPHGMKAWFCTQYFNVPSSEPWDVKIKALLTLLWRWTFTRSSEHHEGNSYWQYNHGLDKRIKTLAAWEEASKTDPNFMLNIQWPKAKHKNGQLMTVRSLVSEMLGTKQSAGNGSVISSSRQLVNIVKGIK